MARPQQIYKKILHVRIDAATKQWYEDFNTVDWIKEEAEIIIDENTTLSEKVRAIPELYDMLEVSFKDLKKQLKEMKL
ncbi:hypothetical protein LCGC14_1742220 [marine sediment metagenome]|uniref:Uncharacterized protein n=1 Tax=marine sediment metagenome TaxID=412755 RepID=A0A0F9H6A2_9ZZZZ